jgi:hypothetical protein
MKGSGSNSHLNFRINKKLDVYGYDKPDAIKYKLAFIEDSEYLQPLLFYLFKIYQRTVCDSLKVEY